jgi:hypothetical protein
MSLRRLTLVLIAAANLTWLMPAFPAGPEFRVNTDTYSYQTHPSVARDAVGNFLVVWEGLGAGRVNGSIRGQRYDAKGEPRGDEFKVNSYTPPEILYPGMARPVVASDPAGNFVVVWESWGSQGTDTSGSSIQARRFDSSGTPQGDQFQVNTAITMYRQWNPSVAVDAGGNSVVVWETQTGVNGYETDRIVRGQRYDNMGAPRGGEFEVGAYTTDFQSQPVVASDLAGNFIVVWWSALPPAEGTFVADSDSIQAQRFDNTGTPQGGQFQVSTTTAGYQNFPAVAADNAGNAVIVWRHSLADVNVHWIDNVILGQRFDSTGRPQGGEFQVNSSPTSFFNKEPAVAMDAAGNFVVAWIDYAFEDPNEFIRLNFDIEARRYDNTGTPQGGQFHVTSTNIDEDYPAVASDAAGNFVVAWQNSIGDPLATSGDFDIYARRYKVSDFPVTDRSPGLATVVIRAGKQAKFVTKPRGGHRFALPATDPKTAGGSLRIFDLAATAGDNTFDLPSGASWTALGSPAGSKGFKYVGKGTPSDPCNVIVRPTVIKATCTGDAITLAPPFAGKVGVVLNLGTGDRYCAQLGGDEVKNVGTLTKRKNAPAPGACP